MVNKVSSQKGFVALEVILLVVILAIVGGTGYFVYNANKQTGDTFDAASKSAQSSAPKTAKKNKPTSVTQSQFKFTEIGMQFALPEALKGLSYTVQKLPNDQGVMSDVLYLDDPSLAVLLNKCVDSFHGTNKSETANFAAINRVEGKYDAAKEQGESGLLKQFDTFHILIGYPNGAICGSDDETLNQQWFKALGASQKAFADAFKSTATEIK